MRFLREAVQIVRTNFRAYLVINAVMYGLMLAAFGLALLFPGLTAAQVTSMEDDGTMDLVVSLLDNVWMFALLIFAVNALRVSVLTILLPSMVVPFAGIALFAYNAVTIGLTLAPHDRNGWLTLIPHSLTVVVEFQAYVLLVLGAFLLGKAWLRPRSVGADSRRQGYVRGLRQVGWLALPALALLIFGAIYEAFSILYLVPPLIA